MRIATLITAIRNLSKIPQETLLSMKYADERRAQIGHEASLDFLPGKINGKVGAAPL